MKFFKIIFLILFLTVLGQLLLSSCYQASKSILTLHGVLYITYHHNGILEAIKEQQRFQWKLRKHTAH